MAQPFTRMTVRLLTMLLAFAGFATNEANAQCTATLTASDDTVCIWGNVTLYASPNGLYDYQWFKDGQLGPLGIESWTYGFGWNETGTHTFSVQITDFNNCTVISNTVTVVVLDEPVAQTAGGGAYCLGSSIQLGVYTNNGITFNWTGPNNFTSTLQNPAIPNLQIANLGQYNVSVSNGGCTSWDALWLDTISSVPEVDATLGWNMPSDVCEYDFVYLDGYTTGFSTITFSQWTGPNNYIGNGGSLTPTMADSGVFTLTVTGTDCANNVVTVSDTLHLHVHPMPLITVTGNGPLCPGSTLQMSATVSNAITYQWAGPNSYTSTNLSDSITNMQTINSGPYVFTAVNGQCIATAYVDGYVLTNNPSYDMYTDTGSIFCIGEASVIEFWNVYDINNPVFSVTGPNSYSSNSMFNWIPLTSYADTGTYIYTISGMPNCGTVPILITDSIHLQIEPCVWPGDVNNDLITDNFDVLDLGLGYGTLGPNRPGASYQWHGQHMTDWGVMQFCGVDMKYADCNGNGIITASDTFGIALNYSLTHLKGGIHVPQAKSTAWPDLYFDLSGVVFTPGATVHIPIKLGTGTIPMVNVYGLAAQVKITGVTPTDGPIVTAPAGWMGSLADALNFNKWIGTNQVDWAYVRIDHTNANGYGQIAELQFTVPPGSQYQQIQMYFDNVRIIGNTGNVITTVNILDDTATVYPTEVGGSATSVINNVTVAPNPSDGQATLRLSVQNDTRAHVTISDIAGRTIWSASIDVTTGTKEIELPVGEIASGIYTIQVKDDKGILAKTLKWVRK